MTHNQAIEARPRLSSDELPAVITLIDRVTEHDGMRPISEHVWLHLKVGGDVRGQHLLARSDTGELIGYAHLDVTDQVDGPSAEVAVDPGFRRQGVGRRLINELIAHSPDGRLRLWTHGEQAGAGELAASLGFTHSRVLWQMRRSLFAPLPRPVLPDDLTLQPFRVGLDEEAWLEVNSRAFAQLPDQGGWTRADLDQRLQEPWFSPEGFLMLWQGQRLVGFHWTKVHGRAAGDHAHQHDPIGEVYVVGVDPDERGTGLGRALTLAGLHHLLNALRDGELELLWVHKNGSLSI